MRLAVTLLGLDLFSVEVTTEDASTDPGDCVTTPIGFAPSAGDQRRRLAEVPELS